MDKHIIQTLSYFDIFDYPLTFAEIKRYLSSKVMLLDDELYAIIESIPMIQESNGYYHFLGRAGISEKRAERHEISIQKFAKAKIIAKLLSFIPTIEYIGVSGSLSMNNASLYDDIDLFFITKNKTLWMSRFLVNIFLLVIGQKRKKNEHYANDKICPNMFLEKSKLEFSEKRKTLYTAHEIVQLKTLFNRNDTYALFLHKNRWVNNFFPNILVPMVKRKSASSTFSLIKILISPFEKIAFFLQRNYMKKSKSIEVVTSGRAQFHPVDRQKIILDMYNLRFVRYQELCMDNLWLDREEVGYYFEEKKIRILN